MAILITYMFVAITISALCSLLESVLLSTPQTYITTIGNKTVNNISENKDSAISAILIINTIANTIGSALVGAQAAILFGNVGVGIVSGLFTILILTCSEIIPKSIGTNNYKKLIIPACKIVSYMILCVKPFVWCVEQITKYFKTDTTISEDEIIGTVETGFEDGTLSKEETNFIKNILDFKDFIAKNIMTPRNVIELGFNNGERVSDYINAFNGKNGRLTYSRIPVMDNYHKTIKGYVLKDEIMSDTINPEDDISQYIHPILEYSENTSLNKIFKDMLKKKEHISAIFDEYYTFVGIVTLEDIIETLLGFEIMDETDEVADLQKLAIGKIKENN